jgi:hypothetical protein
MSMHVCICLDQLIDKDARNVKSVVFFHIDYFMYRAIIKSEEFGG